MSQQVLHFSTRSRYMDEHGIDVHCLVPLPWLECEPALHADKTKALEVGRLEKWSTVWKILMCYPILKLASILPLFFVGLVTQRHGSRRWSMYARILSVTTRQSVSINLCCFVSRTTGAVGALSSSPRTGRGALLVAVSCPTLVDFSPCPC